MRPDKKKTRHHDSRKAAARAKQKADGEPSKDRKQVGVEKACQEEEEEERGLRRREIKSNWGKYDMPLSSEEEEGQVKTGQDFNEAVRNASE